MIRMERMGFRLAWTLLLSAGLCFTANGQMSNVQSAATSLNYKDLDVAKEFIDKAAAHASTANHYKMWWYRGEVYLAIHKDTSEFNYKTLDKYAAETATFSYMKCIDTDTKGWYDVDGDEDNAHDKLFTATFGLFDNANEAYANAEYEESIRMFMLILDVFPYDDEKTLKRNNISKEVVYMNSYYSAQQLEDWTRGKEYLELLIGMSYYDPTIYLGMSEIYMKEADTVTALKYVEKGRALIEDNIPLMLAEINIYIAQGRVEFLIKKISDAIEEDPSYELLYFNRAYLYTQQKELEKAEADYVEAVTLQPGFFDAHYNLGAMYYNMAIETINVMSELGDGAANQRKYDALKIELKHYFDKALPHLEDAEKLNAKDWYTLNALKEVYARTGNYERSRECAAKIKALN